MDSEPRLCELYLTESCPVSGADPLWLTMDVMFRRNGSYLQAWGVNSLMCVVRVFGASQKWVRPLSYKESRLQLVSQSGPDIVSAVVDATAMRHPTASEAQLPFPETSTVFAMRMLPSHACGTANAFAHIVTYTKPCCFVFGQTQNVWVEA